MKMFRCLVLKADGDPAKLIQNKGPSEVIPSSSLKRFGMKTRIKNVASDGFQIICEAPPL
ncbi:MAG: hypothetical protein ACJA0Q_000842 [Saprospiraceae bacterium]|jgi:hypothetical protein